MGDLLREALAEITSDPVRWIVELVQNGAIIAGVWWFGRRAATKRLAARAARVGAELDAADAADRDAAAMRAESVAVVERARRDAPELLRTAAAKAAADRAAALQQIELEAKALVDQARQMVELEKARVAREASERLVRLTTEGARRYLDERLSDDERRAVARAAVTRFLAELEAERAPEHAGAG